MRFLTLEDFNAVVDEKSKLVIAQESEDNIDRAESYALEEVSSYLRSRYDMDKAFNCQGTERNAYFVMICCDIALYHLISWLPSRMGFEIRKERYERAIEWLVSVQNGKASPLLPLLIDEATGDNIGSPVRWGSMSKNKYDY
jgi:phage gp36-like protein